MINDSLLGDRLNLYREGKLEESQNLENNSIFLDSPKPFSTLANLVLIFLHSLVFGFALKTILSTNWDFLEFISVGFTIQIILTNIFSLLKNKNK